MLILFSNSFANSVNYVFGRVKSPDSIFIRYIFFSWIADEIILSNPELLNPALVQNL